MWDKGTGDEIFKTSYICFVGRKTTGGTRRREGIGRRLIRDSTYDATRRRSSLAIRVDRHTWVRTDDEASWFSPAVPSPLPLCLSLSEPTTKMDPKQRAAQRSVPLLAVCPARACGGRSRSRSVGRDRHVNFNGLCLHAPPPPELPRNGADPTSPPPPITLSGLSARVSDSPTRKGGPASKSMTGQVI